MPIRTTRSRSCRRTAAAVLVAAITGVVLTTAAHAQGTFGPIQTLSPAGADAGSCWAAVDAAGGTFFIWERWDGANMRAQTRMRSVRGTLRPVQTLSPAGQHASVSSPVVVTSNGEAIFTWRRSDGTHERIQARTRATDGTFGPVQTLSGAGQTAWEPWAAALPNGRAIFTWSRSSGGSRRIEARVRTAAGALRPVELVSDTGAQYPKVGVDAAGRSIFTWMRSDFRVEGRARSNTGALGPTEMLTPAGMNAGSPWVTVNAGGAALFVSMVLDDPDVRIQAVSRSSAGALSSVSSLSPEGEDGKFPTAGIDADGNAVVSWLRTNPEGINELVAATRSAAGTVGPVETVGGAPDGFGPDDISPVAVDTAGNAVFVWVEHDGSFMRVMTRTRPAGGALTSVQAVSAAGQNAAAPRVVFDGAGNAVFTWERFDGRNWRVQTRRLVAPF